MNFATPGATDRSGFTILEMMIVAALFTMLIVISLSLVSTSTQAFEAESAAVAVEADARRAMEQMAEELRRSQLTQISTQVPVSPGSASTVAFQPASSIAGMAPAYSSTVTYAYQFNTALNWGEVVRTENGRTATLVSRVAVNGFTLERDPVYTSKLTIRITLQVTLSNQTVVSRTVETSVYPRN